jgi:hypothetical protein
MAKEVQFLRGPPWGGPVLGVIYTVR